MVFSYEAFKQTFVDYFSSKGYKTYVSKRDANLIFMYAANKEVSIIELFNSSKQTEANNIELNRLVKKIAKIKNQNPGDIKVTMLYYDQDAKDTMMIDDNIRQIISNNFDYFKNKLKPNFVDISSLNLAQAGESGYKKIHSSSKMEASEANDLSQVSTNEQLQQKATQFAMNMKKSQGFSTIFMLLAFLIVPLIGSIILMLWNVDGYSLGVTRIFQGGTTYHLTILGGEAWRIWSYGLSSPADNFIISIIVILVAGWSVYNMSKLNAFIMKGWKFFIAFIIAYSLTGYFGSVLMSNYTMGGVMPVLGIVTGMLALNTSGSRTLVSSVSKMKLIWPIVLIIIFPIFTGGGMEYASTISAFAIGGAVAYLFNYDYKNFNWTFILPIIVLLIVILLPSIMLAIPQYVPGVDNDVIYALTMYIRKGLISTDHANNVINNIGWDNISIENNNGILSIPFL